MLWIAGEKFKVYFFVRVLFFSFLDMHRPPFHHSMAKELQPCNFLPLIAFNPLHDG